jgi:hypothetical protein
VFGYRIGDADEDLSFNERDNAALAPLAVVVDPVFTWGDDRPPRIPWHRTLIYELHVKGFSKRTKHIRESHFSATQLARPAEKAIVVGFNLVEAKLPQPDNVEERSKLCPDLHLGDDRGPRFVWLAGIAGQHQPQRSRTCEPAKRLQIRRHVVASNNMVAAAVEEEIKRAGQLRRRIEYVGDEEIDTHAGLVGPLAGTVDGQ